MLTTMINDNIFRNNTDMYKQVVKNPKGSETLYTTYKQSRYCSMYFFLLSYEYIKLVYIESNHQKEKKVLNNKRDR